MNGEIIGTYTTDSTGVIYLPEAESGWYTVTELEAASGYLLDTTPHRIEVKDGQTATLEITNPESCSTRWTRPPAREFTARCFCFTTAIAIPSGSM